jgi:hypothetical protein
MSEQNADNGVAENATVTPTEPVTASVTAEPSKADKVKEVVGKVVARIRKVLAAIETKIQPWKNEIWAAYIVVLAVLLAAFAPKVTLIALGAVVLASGWIMYYGLRKRIKANEGGQ